MKILRIKELLRAIPRLAAGEKGGRAGSPPGQRNLPASIGQYVISRFDLRRTVNKVLQMGKQYGPYFLVLVIIVESLEHFVLPALLFYSGKPLFALSAFFTHWGTIVYSLFFIIISSFERRRKQ